jgi:hypothetical protein
MPASTRLIEVVPGHGRRVAGTPADATPITAYQRIAAVLAQRLDAGEFAPTEQIPSSRLARAARRRAPGHADCLSAAAAPRASPAGTGSGRVAIARPRHSSPTTGEVSTVIAELVAAAGAAGTVALDPRFRALAATYVLLLAVLCTT